MAELSPEARARLRALAAGTEPTEQEGPPDAAAARRQRLRAFAASTMPAAPAPRPQWGEARPPQPSFEFDPASVEQPNPVTEVGGEMWRRANEGVSRVLSSVPQAMEATQLRAERERASRPDGMASPWTSANLVAGGLLNVAEPALTMPLRVQERAREIAAEPAPASPAPPALRAIGDSLGEVIPGLVRPFEKAVLGPLGLSPAAPFTTEEVANDPAGITLGAAMPLAPLAFAGMSRAGEAARSAVDVPIDIGTDLAMSAPATGAAPANFYRRRVPPRDFALTIEPPMVERPVPPVRPSEPPPVPLPPDEMFTVPPSPRRPAEAPPHAPEQPPPVPPGGDDMVGRRVRSPLHRAEGVVVKWEPLGAAMTDVLVRDSAGHETWFGSGDLRPIDGGGPLPNRAEAQKRVDARTIEQLQAIRADHVRDFGKPWPGAEFGKVHVGQSIDAAIADVRRRSGLTPEQPTPPTKPKRPRRPKGETGFLDIGGMFRAAEDVAERNPWRTRVPTTVKGAALGLASGAMVEQPVAGLVTGAAVGLYRDLQRAGKLPRAVERTANAVFAPHGNTPAKAVAAFDARTRAIAAGRERINVAARYVDRSIREVVRRSYPGQSRADFKRRYAETLTEIFDIRTKHAEGEPGLPPRDLYEKHRDFFDALDALGKELKEVAPDLIDPHIEGYLPYYYAESARKLIGRLIQEGAYGAGADFARAFGQHSEPMGRTKQRISEEKWSYADRKANGLITDPIYAVRRAFVELTTLIETRKLQNTIAEMPEVVTTKAERKTIRDLEGALAQAKQEGVARVDLETRLEAAQEAYANKTGDFRREEYVQLPKGDENERIYGPLAGAYVPRSLAADLRDILRSPQDFESMSMFRKGIELAVGMSNAVFKLGKTAMSPVLHVVQTAGNVMFHDMAGFPVAAQLAYVPRAIAEIRKAHKGATVPPWIEQAIRDGATEGSYIDVESTMLDHIEQGMKESESAPVGSGAARALAYSYGLAKRFVWSPVVKTYKGAGAVYQANDAVFKLAHYMYARETLQIDGATAGPRASRAGLNYREAPKYVQQTGHYWHPFILFPWKYSEHFARNAANHPVRAFKWLAALKMADYAFDALSEDEGAEGTVEGAAEGLRDVPTFFGFNPATARGEKLAKQRAGQGLLGRKFSMRAPYKSELGEPIDFNIGRMLPFVSGDPSSDSALPAAVAPVEALTFAQPFGLELLQQAPRINKDFFTGKPIVGKGQTAGGEITDRMIHAWRTFSPGIAADVERLWRSSRGEAYYGEQRSVGEAAQIRLGVQAPVTEFAGPEGRYRQLATDVKALRSEAASVLSKLQPGTPRFEAKAREFEQRLQRLVQQHEQHIPGTPAYQQR